MNKNNSNNSIIINILNSLDKKDLNNFIIINILNNLGSLSFNIKNNNNKETDIDNFIINKN